MSSIIFGYTVSLSNAATPSTGFLVAYDDDGILKQKDSLGVITPIGGGPTAGFSSTFSLAQVLAVSNDSESYSILMGTGTSLSSQNGPSSLYLDYGSVTSSVYLTNGYNYVSLTNGSINIVNDLGNSIEISNNSSYIQLFSTGSNIYSDEEIRLSVYNSSDDILIKSNIGVTVSSADENNGAIFIGSRNSSYAQNITNTVVIGGVNQNALSSNSVYVPDVYIQDSKKLRGTLGDANLRFTEYNDLIIENNSSLLAVLSSSSSVTLTKNGVLIFDTDATVNSPSVDSSPVFISTKNSVIDAGIKNAVIIGGENLTNSMTNSVVLGNYVNINNQYTLPNIDGLNGYIMTTDGSGNVTWQPQTVPTTPSLSQVLAVDDYTDIYSIEMGTATSIYSINGGGQINLDFGTSSSVLISTDNGALSTAYIQLDNSDIVIDSSAELSIAANTASLVITNGRGLVYGFDYSSTFVTYSLVDKNYVDLGTSSIWSNFNNYLPLTGGTLTGDLTINGNLAILGTQTVINTENLYVEDNIITLNATYSGPAIIDAGIEVNLGDGTYSKILWDAGTLYWQAGLSGSESTIITENGSGLLKSNNELSVDFATVSSVSYVDAGTTSLWNYITSATPSLSDVLLVGNTTNGTDIVTSNDDVIIAATGGGVLNLRFGSNGSVVVGVPAETYGGKGGSGAGGGVLYLDPSAITLGLNGGDYSKPYIYLTTSYSQLADYSTHSSVYYGFNLYRNSSFNNYSNGVSIKENVTFNFTSSNQNNYAIIIGSRNSTINAGVYNSVVIGGQGLSATESNMVVLGSTVSINNAYKLPNVDGLNGQVLTTNGSGIASWSTASTSNFSNANLTLTGSRTHTIPSSNTLYIGQSSYVGPYLYLGGTNSGLSNDYTLLGYSNNYIDVDNDHIINWFSLVNRFSILSSETVINESGGNYDLRVEGDTDANLFFLDASNDGIGIGTNITFTGVKATINTNSSSKYLGLNIDASSYNGTFNYGIISNAQSSNATYNIGIESRPSNGIINDIGFKAQLGGTTVTKTGLELSISGNGLSTTNYGIYNSVSGANGTQYGSYTQVTGTYSLSNYGQYMSVDLGNITGYGSYISIQGDSTGSYTGQYLNIAQNTGTNSQVNYGSRINMLGDGSFNTGLLSISKYGSLSNFGVWAAVGTNVAYTVGDIALYAWVSDDAQLTAYPSEAGRFENRSKSSQNYGISVYNTSTYSTTNTGLYIRNDSATVTNNAILVDTGNSIFNESGGDYDFRIEGDTDVNLFFTDASTNRIGIGNNNPSYKLQVSGTVSSTNAFNVNGLDGWSGTFSADGQIVTVTGGIITGVV